jgi:hypothetical protein
MYEFSHLNGACLQQGNRVPAARGAGTHQYRCRDAKTRSGITLTR